MVATKEQATMGSTKDHHHPNNQYPQQPHPLSIKGKRTKRPPRTASSAALATMSSSLVSPSASAASNYSGTEEGIDARVTTATATSSTTTASAQHPSSHISGSATTAEEEDMANCLILLAQSSNSNHHHVTDYKNPTTTQKLTEISRHQQQPTVSVPVTVPKAPTTMMVSTASATTSSSSVAPTARAPVNYAYECKTCNRSFPSFQALGGHRASHKKPKQSPPPPTDLDVKQITHLSPFSDHHDAQYKPSLSLQIGTTDSSNNHHNNTAAAATNSTSTVPLINKSKVHECTICGAEFSSGQALGGHMRRHRTLLSAASAASAASASAAVSALQPMMIGADATRNQNNIEEQEDVKRTRNLLSLDLNLPAPEDDHRGGDEQQQQSFVFKSSDKTLFFSASSLVDCHY